ncbi:MAG: filamentous hemagglutinin N-terminal domain-containing protein [Candidatus Competibacteraceae bacterium]|nr:filamentous hemagglutinin N-terminal domain-containing protein [Candidatus Competibacteraceae bacterium]MCP5126019.1 filamentous hemagglutinin N-terminal domain-containing protein [Gammaproteobacteria bacterium]
MMQFKLWRWALALTIYAGSLPAQVTLDGTLGQAGALPGPDYAITADLGQQVGGNLFHSFGTFSIPTGASATFSGPASVNNIIGRVTGGQVSQIDGTLRSTIPGASLYLLNPAGVLFGKNARLDVPGSVHLSTADTLRLSDGGQFDARTPANSLLTVAPVEAFGFLSDTPAPITIKGSFLEVPQGQTLSLIGGDLTIANGTLYAPVGRINIATVGSPGEVTPTLNGLELRGFSALGTFQLQHDGTVRPHVDAVGTFQDVELGNLDVSGAGGGTLFIRGGQWLNQGGWVFSDTYSDRNAGEIHVALNGAMQFEQGSRLTAVTLDQGNGGVVTLDVGALTLNDGAFVSSAAWFDAQGNSGDITVNAREAVTLAGIGPDNDPSSLFADTLARASSVSQAGTIKVTAPVVTITRQGSMQSNSRSLIGGQPGVIILDVDTLNLSEGGVITVDNESALRGGAIRITARQAVLITGSDAAATYTGLSASAKDVDRSNGAAGSIQVTTPHLTLTGNGVIRNVTRNMDATDSIVLNVDTLTVTGGAQIVAITRGDGHGSDLVINAQEAVTVAGYSDRNASSLSASAIPARKDLAGDAGSITITTPRLMLNEGGQITTATTSAGRGGDITVNASAEVTIADSDLSATAEPGSSNNGGNIIVTTPRLALTEGGQIATATFSAGDSGNITINAREAVFIAGRNNEAYAGLYASAEDHATGQAGAITVTTPSLTLQSGRISGNAQKTTGGVITIYANHLKLLDGSEISSFVQGKDLSDGGNVTVNSINAVALNGSRISAQANQGRGGNILVNAEVFLHDAPDVQDVLNASSRIEGNDGTVELNAPTTDISGSLVTLNGAYLDISSQISPRCSVSDADERSHFIMQGRGALPPAPDRPLSVITSRCDSGTAEGPQPAPRAAELPGAERMGFGDR